MPAAASDVARGTELFTANCASCHAKGENFVNAQRTLQADALKKYLGANDEIAVRKFLQESNRHQNQAYFRAPGGKLTSTDWDDVAAFVSKTALENEWQ